MKTKLGIKNLFIAAVLVALSGQAAATATCGSGCDGGNGTSYNTGSESVSYTRDIPQYGDQNLLDNAGNPGPFGPFIMFVNYTRSFDGVAVTKDVQVNFNFDPVLNWGDTEKSTYINTVEANIEAIWNNKFAILDTDSGASFPLAVDLTTAGPFDQNVFVHAGEGRANVDNWYSQDSASVNAHEFGHMLGLFDEYIGGGVDQYPNPTLSNDGLMGLGALNPDPVLYSRYYQDYFDYMNTLNPGHSFQLVEFGQVPEPSTLALLFLGWILISFMPGTQRRVFSLKAA